MSLPSAKNAMYRAIEALYYRPLNKEEKDRIWNYFSSKCAYCDKLIDRDNRHGHMDHLECSASGGNYIRNRVLACKECNGNEKREREWQDFLKSKCSDDEAFCVRMERIEIWQSHFPPLIPLVLSPNAELAKEALLASIQRFEQEFIRFRALLPRRRAPKT